MNTRAQRWVPIVLYGGTILVGATTIAVSGLWLTRLADLLGMTGVLAVSLPVTVDAGGAVGTVLWLTGPSKDARRWGRGVAVTALGASIVGNILAHLIGLGLLAVSAPLVVGVSAVYPTMTWAMVHALVLLRGPTRMPTGKPTPSRTPAKPAAGAKPAAPAPPEPSSVPLHVVDSAEAAGSKREQARDWFLGQVAAGRDPHDIKPAEIDRAIGASGYAKKFITTWRSEATPTAAVNE